MIKKQKPFRLKKKKKHKVRKQAGDGGNIWSLCRDKRYISITYRSMKKN